MCGVSWIDGQNEAKKGRQTVGPGTLVSALPKASQPTISEMSCISVFTSLAGVDCDRSWLSLASRHGCRETWTLEGSADMLMVSSKV